MISTCRPGARIAGSGRISRHASGNAVDFEAGNRKGAIINWLVANHKKGGTMTYPDMSHIHIDVGQHFVSLAGGRKYASHNTRSSKRYASDTPRYDRGYDRGYERTSYDQGSRSSSRSRRSSSRRWLTNVIPGTARVPATTRVATPPCIARTWLGASPRPDRASADPRQLRASGFRPGALLRRRRRAPCRCSGSQTAAVWHAQHAANLPRSDLAAARVEGENLLFAMCTASLENHGRL